MSLGSVWSCTNGDTDKSNINSIYSNFEQSNSPHWNERFNSSSLYQEKNSDIYLGVKDAFNFEDSLFTDSSTSVISTMTYPCFSTPKSLGEFNNENNNNNITTTTNNNNNNNINNNTSLILDSVSVHNIIKSNNAKACPSTPTEKCSLSSINHFQGQFRNIHSSQSPGPADCLTSRSFQFNNGYVLPLQDTTSQIAEKSLPFNNKSSLTFPMPSARINSNHEKEPFICDSKLPNQNFHKTESSSVPLPLAMSVAQQMPSISNQTSYCQTPPKFCNRNLSDSSLPSVLEDGFNNIENVHAIPRRNSYPHKTNAASNTSALTKQQILQTKFFLDHHNGNIINHAHNVQPKKNLRNELLSSCAGDSVPLDHPHQNHHHHQHHQLQQERFVNNSTSLPSDFYGPGIISSSFENDQVLDKLHQHPEDIFMPDMGLINNQIGQTSFFKYPPPPPPPPVLSNQRIPTSRTFGHEVYPFESYGYFPPFFNPNDLIYDMPSYLYGLHPIYSGYRHNR